MYNPGVKKNNYKQKTICVLQCNSIHSLNFAGKNLYVIRFNEKRKERDFHLPCCAMDVLCLYNTPRSRYTRVCNTQSLRD